MSLKNKTLIIIGSLVICTLTVIYIIAQFWLIEDIIALERQSARSNVASVDAAFAREQMNLLKTAAVYSENGTQCDDSKQDIGAPEALSKATGIMGSRDPYFIVWKSPGGKLSFFGPRGETLETISRSTALADVLQRAAEKARQSGDGISGIVVAGADIFLIAAHTAEPCTPGIISNETAIALLRIDERELGELSALTRLVIDIRASGEKNPPGDFAAARRALADVDLKFYEKLQGKTLFVYKLKKDIFGRQSVLMKVELSSRVINETRRLMRRFLLLSLLAGAVIAFASAAVLQRQVISRIAGLVEGVRRISVSLDISRRMQESGTDEIAYLAKSINGMLAGLEQAQISLIKSEEEHRSLIEHLNVGVFRHEADMDGRYLMANQALARMFRFDSVEQLLAEPMENFFESRAVMEKLVETVEKEGETRDWEIEMRRRDGSTILVNLSCKAVLDSIGNIYVVDGLAEDITEWRRAEESMREALQRFESVVENTPSVAVQGFDKDGTIIHWNTASESVYGFAGEDVTGKRIQDVILGPEAADEFSQVLEQVWVSGEPYGPNEWPVTTKSGEMRWVISTIFPVFEQGKTVEVFCMDVDITQRKKAEEALLLSEEMYRETIDAFLDPLHVVDRDLRIIIANRVFVNWLEELGLNKEILGRGIFSVFHFLPDSVRGQYLQVFETGKIMMTEEKNEIDGKAVYTETRKIPVVEMGRVEKVITVVRDITERKMAEEELAGHRDRLEELVGERTAELNKTRDMLESSERLAMLGRFAGGISHELRNPLAVIATIVYYLKKKLSGADKITIENLDKIKKQVDNCSGIIESVLDLTRPDTSNFERLDISEVLLATIESATIPERIKMTMDTESAPLAVKGGEQQLRMVFGNLLRNAVQAMPGAGEIEIAARETMVHGNSFVEICFSDTGEGVPAENAERIFQPLFTTKTRGTGLGLAIVKMVVEKHGGTISVVPGAGKGTTFIVRLPAI